MGTQQLLLIVLGVIIVGIAVVVGINIFGTNAEQANKDAITQDCLRLAAAAQGFYRKPTMLGGGNNSFVGIEIEDCGMSNNGDIMTGENVNGTYVLSGATATGLVVTGTSQTDNTQTVTLTLDMTGTTDDERVSIAYAGW